MKSGRSRQDTTGDTALTHLAGVVVGSMSATDGGQTPISALSSQSTTTTTTRPSTDYFLETSVILPRCTAKPHSFSPPAPTGARPHSDEPSSPLASLDASPMHGQTPAKRTRAYDETAAFDAGQQRKKAKGGNSVALSGAKAQMQRHKKQGGVDGPAGKQEEPERGPNGLSETDRVENRQTEQVRPRWAPTDATALFDSGGPISAAVPDTSSDLPTISSAPPPSLSLPTSSGGIVNSMIPAAHSQGDIGFRSESLNIPPSELTGDDEAATALLMMSTGSPKPEKARHRAVPVPERIKPVPEEPVWILWGDEGSDDPLPIEVTDKLGTALFAVSVVMRLCSPAVNWCDRLHKAVEKEQQSNKRQRFDNLLNFLAVDPDRLVTADMLIQEMKGSASSKFKVEGDASNLDFKGVLEYIQTILDGERESRSMFDLPPFIEFFQIMVSINDCPFRSLTLPSRNREGGSLNGHLSKLAQALRPRCSLEAGTRLLVTLPHLLLVGGHHQDSTLSITCERENNSRDTVKVSYRADTRIILEGKRTRTLIIR